MSFNFVKINTLPNTEVNTNVDILGIIKSAGDCTEIQSKKNPGTVLLKRDLVVMDDSGVDVRVTLWAEKAQQNNGWEDNPIVAFKSLKVNFVMK